MLSGQPFTGAANSNVSSFVFVLVVAFTTPTPLEFDDAINSIFLDKPLSLDTIFTSLTALQKTVVFVRIKVLTISDHPLSPSGVGTQTKYIIEALLKSDEFDVVSLGGAIKHPDHKPQKTEQYG